ncbi:alpha-D-ribose 1-methylphosphonate 5-triphosphate diphosphatase [Desulfovibrio litoralis]|uniref:Alpha-D-ribose 1-methylphosphonate 5-triphosphate diphosphatase n=1 Tax=Desulfovibrio litoralis DSM 11393 TaxID=1121455 RepID=A0A1M7ST14_9BACT|nr:alpha-D-ribose 1-methylphosphonate 5-triphosphate diphosphatase [Desulfovibrio litoralis]SHN61514.1 alpha-D-ribose 1-methylphosphonate 5-triphosphate diphosphatase [Desulfovibrio litoralis DSM 11393]
MPKELCFINAKVVTPQNVINGYVIVKDGIIKEVGEGTLNHISKVNGNCHIEDMENDYLIPGLVELHTDNLEKHLEPRAGVLWSSSRNAFLAHDAQLAAAGMTTVLDSLSVGEYHSKKQRSKMLEMSIQALNEVREHKGTRVNHYLHLRCEVSDPQMPELFNALISEPDLRLVSLMDHTPGQRQFANEENYRTYYQSSFQWTDEEFQERVVELKEIQKHYAKKHEAQIIAFCRQNNIILASHDDACTSHIDDAISAGIKISEFPTTMQAAKYAVDKGLLTIMGSPNIMRGGSHSGNISALAVAKENALCILSSDYAPHSLLPAAFILYEENVFDLPTAINLITKNPAEAVGLNDRGEILQGKKADLVRVACNQKQTNDSYPYQLPEVRTVWNNGIRVI